MNTSQKAKTSIDAKAIREQVFQFIEAQDDGATCDEVEAALGMKHQTASARIRELYEADRIVRPGNTRKTRSGRAAEVCYASGKEREQQAHGDVIPYRKQPSPTSILRTSKNGWQCKRCGCDTVWDTPIHNGASVRRDCARCGRTDGFPVWKEGLAK